MAEIQELQQKPDPILVPDDHPAYLELTKRIFSWASIHGVQLCETVFKYAYVQCPLTEQRFDFGSTKVIHSDPATFTLDLFLDQLTEQMCVARAHPITGPLALLWRRKPQLYYSVPDSQIVAVKARYAFVPAALACYLETVEKARDDYLLSFPRDRAASVAEAQSWLDFFLKHVELFNKANPRPLGFVVTREVMDTIEQGGLSIEPLRAAAKKAGLASSIDFPTGDLLVRSSL